MPYLEPPEDLVDNSELAGRDEDHDNDLAGQ
jgi:hypothetical protein